MKKIAVVTATRAEYGLLALLVQELRKYEEEELKIELIVTGTHLYEAYGNTIHEIEADGVRIDHRIKVSVKSDSEMDITKNQADVLLRFADLFAKERYDGVVLLGDRYETLAIAIAAGNMRIPIFHLCGGDTTEGAIDEWIRHSITKMAYLHFPTNEESRQRIIQLGEDPDRVFNFGSTSIDNILRQATMSKEEALESIGLTDCRYAVCTYHPVTMENKDVSEYIEQFLAAIKAFPDIEFIVTKSNADQGGARINQLLDQADTEIENLHVFSSLGVKRYLSLMKYAEFVMGNSSSGIIETPAFHVPTVNIGDRQKGRLQCDSILNCASDTASIVAAVKQALTKEFRQKCEKIVCPYGDGNAASLIAEKIVRTVLEEKIDLKKIFYNLEK